MDFLFFLESIWRDKQNEPQLGIRWYYKPSDVVDGEYPNL